MDNLTLICGIFISAPHNGTIFIAERSRKGSRKLLWSTHGQRIEANTVPYQIRRQAYRHLAKTSYASCR